MHIHKELKKFGMSLFYIVTYNSRVIELLGEFNRIIVVIIIIIVVMIIIFALVKSRQYISPQRYLARRTCSS